MVCWTKLSKNSIQSSQLRWTWRLSDLTGLRGGSGRSPQSRDQCSIHDSNRTPVPSTRRSGAATATLTSALGKHSASLCVPSSCSAWFQRCFNHLRKHPSRRWVTPVLANLSASAIVVISWAFGKICMTRRWKGFVRLCGFIIPISWKATLSINQILQIIVSRSRKNPRFNCTSESNGIWCEAGNLLDSFFLKNKITLES